MTIWLARDRRKGAHFEPGNMILPELGGRRQAPARVAVLHPDPGGDCDLQRGRP